MFTIESTDYYGVPSKSYASSGAKGSSCSDKGATVSTSFESANFTTNSWSSSESFNLSVTTPYGPEYYGVEANFSCSALYERGGLSISYSGGDDVEATKTYAYSTTHPYDFDTTYSSFYSNGMRIYYRMGSNYFTFRFSDDTATNCDETIMIYEYKYEQNGIFPPLKTKILYESSGKKGSTCPGSSEVSFQDFSYYVYYSDSIGTYGLAVDFTSTPPLSASYSPKPYGFDLTIVNFSEDPYDDDGLLNSYAKKAETIVVIYIIIFGIPLICFVFVYFGYMDKQRAFYSARRTDKFKDASKGEYETFLVSISSSPYIGERIIFTESRKYFFAGDGELEDFLRVLCNAHGLLSMLLVDPEHPLNIYERQVAFFIDKSFSFMAAAVILYLTHDIRMYNEDYANSLVQTISYLVVMPSMIFVKKFIYFLLACPCKLGKDLRESVHERLEFAGYVVVAPFVLTGMGFVVVGAYLVSLVDFQHDGDGVIWFFEAYVAPLVVVSNFQDLFLLYLPFIPSGNSGSSLSYIVKLLRVLTCGFVPISSWHIERVKLLGIEQHDGTANPIHSELLS